MKNTLIVLATRLLVVLVAPLPRRVLASLGRAIGACAWLFMRTSRAIAERNLALAFPAATAEERRALAKTAFVTLGSLLGETFSRVSPRPIDDAPLPFDSPESEAALVDARACGRGVMLLSAHLGPYEDVARSLLARGAPLLAVTKAAYDPRLDFVFARLRRGVPAVARDEPGAAMRMVRHLRRGGVLGVPMDLASRVPSVEAPFFGVSARTPVGPARIALRTNAAVVVCTAVRAAGGRAGHAMKVSAIRTDDLAGPSGERALVARINAELCERIRSMPEAWPWMHPRFGPPAETSRVCGLPVEETR